MLSSCEKKTTMAVIPPTANEWTQIHVDEKCLNNMASTVRPLMEKPASSTRDQHQQLQQQQQQQQQLKCPRCDSSNTKFCYYNNYSLSQPRHFCKSCKRYWTRGGTLRNVPVGGGCRKNKRVKRPSIDGASHAPTSSVAVAAASSATVSDPPHTRLPQIENLSSATANSNPLNLNTLFYGNLPIGHHPEMNNNLTFPRLSSLYDLPPQLNALGLGFSSANGIICGNSGDGSFQEGYSTAGNSIQDLAMQTNPLLPSSYNSVFGSSCSSSSTTTTVPATMASLIASTIQYQQKFMIDASGLKESRGLSANYFKQSVSPFEELEGLGNSNDVKIEESPNRTEWSMNPTEQTGLSDPGSIRWSTSNVGNSWHDPASNINLGSSVPSLI